MTRNINIVCADNIADNINKDFRNIRKGENVGLIDGKYNDKAEYLGAISKDSDVMKYIKPRSEIGEEITKLQEAENTKTKNFDFER